MASISTLVSPAAASAPSPVTTPSGNVVTPSSLENVGPWRGPLTGITGVGANGNMTVQIPCTARYHSISLWCAGGTAVAANQTYLSGGGVVTATIGTVFSSTGVSTGVNGVIAVRVTTTATTTANGFYVIWSAAGDGSAVGIQVVGGQIVSAVILAQGGGGWVNPSIFFTGPVHVYVGSLEVRGWFAGDILSREQTCGYLASNGELPLIFTEARMKDKERPTLTSWDLKNQASAQIQATCNGNLVNPSVIGTCVFDYRSNQVTFNGVTSPSYHIIAHRRITTALLAAGQVDIQEGTIPIGQPIRRLWFEGSTPGAITYLEVKQDNNPVLSQVNAPAINAELARFGFAMNYPNGATNVITPAGTVFTPFDTALIMDPDDNVFKSLTVLGDLKVRVTQSVSQTITILVEQHETLFE